jgi:cytochrome P450
MNAPPTASAFIPDTLPEPGYEDLAHLPGPPPPRIHILKVIDFLKDPLGKSMHMLNTYGRVFRRKDFGGWGVSLIGPEANELVLFNKDRIFSSALGWNPVLERLFPRGLMLMDFEAHRVHRKSLSVAFKTGPMQHYLGGLLDGMARNTADWPTRGQFKFYPAIKALTLDLAATSFLGVPWGKEAGRINTAFMDMVLASVAPIRTPLPFTQMRRGVQGRAYMSAFFAAEIPKRRGTDGKDIFSHICNATTESGALLTDQEIIDHMNFLMMAAHDTITSSLTSMVHFLTQHPDWQDRLRAEVQAVAAKHGGLTYAALDEMTQTEMVFKEALRLIPPVPAMPRRALKDFVFMNHHIPAGSQIGLNTMLTHRLPEIWPDPERFDPTRFTPENSRDRHKYAWIPFGGGAHMCLGLHFAHMQVKAFVFTVLMGHRITVDPGYVCDFQMFPIPRPKDGLPVRVEPL